MAIITSRTNENGRITFIYEKCNSCGLCVKICKDFSLKMENGKPVLSNQALFGCVACGHCMAICQNDAIQVVVRCSACPIFFSIAVFRSGRPLYSSYVCHACGRKSGIGLVYD